MRINTKIFVFPALLGIALMLVLTTGCQPQGEEPAPEQDNQQEAPVGDNAEATLDAIPYPLDYCLVTNEKLGSMGEPVSVVFQGQEFKVCCSGCVDTIEKDVAGYLVKLEDAGTKNE